ncbi:MAG TPA: hypothetical protein VGS62_11660, partial [Streptosporangiaceae bacterium]|nr:hypothetical protein [Streptosporangiaceae bacterium]
MPPSQSQPGEAQPAPPAGPARPQAVTQSSPRNSPPAGPARPRAAVQDSPPIDVEDRLERRIRKPIDLLRFTVTCVEIVLLAGFGVVASATTTGVETNIVTASRHLPYIALAAARPLTLFALLVLPVALAGRELARGRGRRLAEAAATGMLAVAVVLVTDAVLRSGAGAKLYDAITMSRPGASHMTPLDAYLA